jgi:hypothetical protein
MAQQPGRSIAAPVPMERNACAEQEVEQSEVMDQGAQPASAPDRCRRAGRQGCAHPIPRSASLRKTGPRLGWKQGLSRPTSVDDVAQKSR